MCRIKRNLLYRSYNYFPHCIGQHSVFPTNRNAIISLHFLFSEKRKSAEHRQFPQINPVSSQNTPPPPIKLSYCSVVRSVNGNPINIPHYILTNARHVSQKWLLLYSNKAAVIKAATVMSLKRRSGWCITMSPRYFFFVTWTAFSFKWRALSLIYCCGIWRISSCCLRFIWKMCQFVSCFRALHAVQKLVEVQGHGKLATLLMRTLGKCSALCALFVLGYVSTIWLAYLKHLKEIRFFYDLIWKIVFLFSTTTIKTFLNDC